MKSDIGSELKPTHEKQKTSIQILEFGTKKDASDELNLWCMC